MHGSGWLKTIGVGWGCVLLAAALCVAGAQTVPVPGGVTPATPSAGPVQPVSATAPTTLAVPETAASSVPVVVPLTAAVAPAAPGSRVRMVLLFTSNVLGETDPCG
ncbi:MAG: hypothetical protein HY816_15160 [Candidatus Wallbacteria bacterium]|nr:hypothetical protein [Candidatus Wallbacteria bacterium]